jgi:hypothetical protein
LTDFDFHQHLTAHRGPVAVRTEGSPVTDLEYREFHVQASRPLALLEEAARLVDALPIPAHPRARLTSELHWFQKRLAAVCLQQRPAPAGPAAEDPCPADQWPVFGPVPTEAGEAIDRALAHVGEVS